jgi:hypothetical protein
MTLLDDILDNHDRMMESADREDEYYGTLDDEFCYKCNQKWTVDEICRTCEQCPDCCECEK